MEKNNLEGFVEKVVEYSLSHVPEQGIYAGDFEKKVFGYLSNIFPNSCQEDLDPLYKVFHWGFICNPESPFDYVLPENKGGESMIVPKNGTPDKSRLAKNIYERYGDDLSERIRRNLN